MNLLERIPTRWLLAGAALACLVLWTAPSVAQTTGDAESGMRLFADTPNESGQTQLGTCTNCHLTVQDRRNRIATTAGIAPGGAFADIDFDDAMDRFGLAIGGNFGGVMGQFSALNTQQIQDIAAYIADVPKLTATDLSTTKTLAFVATAVNNAVIRNITIRHSVATASNLQVTGVSLAAGTSAFVRNNNCNPPRTLLPDASCTFSVTYTPTTTTAESKVLTVTLQQGTVTFTRTITLNGSVAGVATPTPPAASDDSGGGALGWAWLTGLALGTIALMRRRRT